MANKYLQVYDTLSPLLAMMHAALGDEYKVTFVARNTKRKNAEVILGDDENYDDVIKVLAKYRKKAPKVAFGRIIPS